MPRAARRSLRLFIVPFLWGVALAPGSAAHAGPTISELVEVADMASLAPSPDGRLVAFRVQRPSIHENSYELDWYVADLVAGRVRRVAGGGVPIYGDAGPLETEPVFWSPDSRFIYHRALIDGVIGIWRTSADGSTSRAVIAGDSDVEQLEQGGDGASLLFRTGPTREAILRAEKNEYDEGILVDSSVDLAQNLYRGGSVHGRMASQRLIGRWYQRDGLLWNEPRVQHRLDLRTSAVSDSGILPSRAVEPLTVSAAAPSLSARSATGQTATAIVTSDRSMLEASGPGGGRRVCAAEPCRSRRIVALAWRPSHEELIFTVQDHHFRQSLYLWNPDSGRVRLVARGEGLLSGARDLAVPCAITVQSALCLDASPASPPKLERIDLETGRRSLIFDPNAALRLAPAPVVEPLTWALGDGRQATGTLLMPPNRPSRRMPLFVDYYQCPGYLRGGIGDEFPFAPMVDAGFIVACLNMVPFDDPRDGVGRYQAALASVDSLIGLLVRRGLVDPARVGMGGFSAGSEATMWVAMNSRLLAAAAIASPQYEPSSYWLSSVRGRDHAKVLRDVFGLGPLEETPGRWKLVSPALNVERINAPLLMQMPEQEARVATELYGRLSNSSTPVELYAFPDEGHVKMQPRHRLAVYNRNLDWFRFWLQGFVDSDPAKSAQYRRWDELRRRQGSAVK